MQWYCCLCLAVLPQFSTRWFLLRWREIHSNAKSTWNNNYNNNKHSSGNNTKRDREFYRSRHIRYVDQLLLNVLLEPYAMYTSKLAYMIADCVTRRRYYYYYLLAKLMAFLRRKHIAIKHTYCLLDSILISFLFFLCVSFRSRKQNDTQTKFVMPPADNGFVLKR